MTTDMKTVTRCRKKPKRRKNRCGWKLNILQTWKKIWHENYFRNTERKKFFKRVPMHENYV